MSTNSPFGKEELQNLRNEYAREELVEESVKPDPIGQFSVWFRQVLLSEVTEPNAMTLATASEEGIPSARIVLLKGFDDRGFTFFTNYESRKGKELAENPFASLCFFWPELERQVRIEGRVVKLGEKESEEYFAKRPELSQLGAWASEQSSKLDARDELEKRFEEARRRFADGEIPKPPHWGGYLLEPMAVEFWQGRPGRLHDRLLYSLQDGKWSITRLSP